MSAALNLPQEIPMVRVDGALLGVDGDAFIPQALAYWSDVYGEWFPRVVCDFHVRPQTECGADRCDP